LKCAGAVKAFHVRPFVLALTSAAGFTAYHAAYPNRDPMLADVGDGAVNGYDVDPCVQCLTASGCASC
jgi:hypothetical protein